MDVVENGRLPRTQQLRLAVAVRGVTALRPDHRHRNLQQPALSDLEKKKLHEVYRATTPTCVEAYNIRASC